MLIGDDSGVERIILIEGKMPTFYEGGVGFFPTQEVDPAALFPALPNPVIQSGAVPDVENLLTSGGALAEGLNLKSLEAAHVVGFYFGNAFSGEAKVVEQAGSQVEGLEMSGGIFRPL